LADGSDAAKQRVAKQRVTQKQDVRTTRGRR
jgi:hypothetical protein